MIHTVKGFIIINEAEGDVFLELPCFFYDPADVGNLISDSSAFSKSSLNLIIIVRQIPWSPLLHIHTFLRGEYMQLVGVQTGAAP